MKVLRFFSLLWIIGTLYTSVNYWPGPFQFIGLSTMDIFNQNSIEAAQFNLNYYIIEDGATYLLPFLSEDGEHLNWMQNENFKYRTHLMSAFTIRKFWPLNQTKSHSLWNKRYFQFSQPVLYDFCKHNRNEANYKLKVSKPSPEGLDAFTFVIKIQRNRFSPSINSVCNSIFQRYGLLSQDYKKVHLDPETLNSESIQVLFPPQDNLNAL